MSKKQGYVLGMGVSGQSAARFLLAKGFRVTGLESKACSFSEIPIQNDKEIVLYSSEDLLVVSPGISFKHPQCLAAKKAGAEVVGEAELALRECQTPAIAVTGTNGKTTVVLMLEHIFRKAGIAAMAVGNVGVPLTEAIQKKDVELFVIELSSYQLDTLRTASFKSAAVLNITEDHLDRYESMEAYAASKARIGTFLEKGGELVVLEETLLAYPHLFNHFPLCSISTKGEYIIYKEKLEYLIPLKYRKCFGHDLNNLLVAYCLSRQYGVFPEVIFDAMETFIRPRHRLEFVRNVEGVAYYNDSKGTNIDAVIKAVRSMTKNVILIAGGVDKGSGYLSWREEFKGKVLTVLAIGEAKEKIQRDLSDSVDVELYDTLESAVERAQSLAKPGDSVLLSPGCASFDMFDNYSHRGDSFVQIVNSLSFRSFA